MRSGFHVAERSVGHGRRQGQTKASAREGVTGQTRVREWRRKPPLVWESG